MTPPALGHGPRALPLLGFVLLLGVLPALGQPPSPPPPKEYEVQLRYQIFAGRNDRLVQFADLTRYLDSIGFQRDPGPEGEAEDPSQTRMTGTIAAANARKLLGDPRVKAVLLAPPGYKTPEEADKPVKVQLQLASGLPADRQSALAEQARGRLARLGFVEAVGYDNRGHTRMVGTIPAGELETLLKDLRWQPSGWLLPEEPVAALPSPLRNVSPVVAIEVIPEPEGVAPARQPPAVPPPPAKGEEFVLKVSPELRDLAAKEGQEQRQRMEVILNFHPGPDDTTWRRDLGEAAPGRIIEGRVGPLVTLLAYPKQALRLAELPMVSAVRLPRPALEQPPVVRGAKELHLQPLRPHDEGRMAALKYPIGGSRIAVVSGDFRGYDKLLGKGLPAGTRYVDLTAERNPSLEPDPFPGDPKALGVGTETARALAPPGADLTLIRIDPAAPHQLEEVARLIAGEALRSESTEHRREQLVRENEDLAAQRALLAEKRKTALENFGQDPKAVKEREDYFKERDALAAREKAHQAREDRYLRLQQGLRSLKGINVVLSTLAWNDGYPVGGSSPLSRHFEDRPFKGALWFQSAGGVRGQSWRGFFHDADGNGVMEFAPAGTPLPAGRWTPELNLLGWQRFGKKPVPDLPAKARLRVSVQWREAHDPEFWRGGEDVYQEPLVDLRLVVLRQRDPSGTRLPADDLEVVARSDGLPQRLDNQPTHATYEHALEFTADPAGRYVVRLEGRAPTGTRPPKQPTLPSSQKSWELWPRLFVDVLDDASRKEGRPIFLDYATDQGGLGMPADARVVIPVAPTP
jgi:hypothetical protein